MCNNSRQIFAPLLRFGIPFVPVSDEYRDSGYTWSSDTAVKSRVVSKTASFEIPAYSLVIIFPSNVGHTMSATEYVTLMSELCGLCNVFCPVK